jgi:hypothetical protein
MQFGDQIAVDLQVGRLVEELGNRIEPLKFGCESVALVADVVLVLEAEDLADVVGDVQLHVECSVASKKLPLVLASHFEELTEMRFTFQNAFLI